MDAGRVRAQVDRILASAAFADAKRASSFLRFVVERELEGRADEIKEFVIAAAANILAEPLREGTVSTRDLAKIQRRREFPTRITQRVQALIRQQVAGSAGVSGRRRSPWILRLLERTIVV
jgi:hypothetical protein